MTPSGSPWPFNVIDLFAYLGQGFTFLAVVNALLKEHHPGWLTPVNDLAGNALGNDLILTFVLILLSYTAGHLLAHIAYPLYEQLLVGKFFGTAAANALGEMKSDTLTLRACVLYGLGVPEYSCPMSAAFRSRLGSAFTDTTGQRLTSDRYDTRICFVAVQESCPATGSRIETFLGLYSFSSNTSFTAAILAALSLILGGWDELALATVFTVVALIMLGHYLRFLRLYLDEIYLGFEFFASERSRRRPLDE